MRGRLIEFKVTETGCLVPTSHKLNPDGYFRKCIVGAGKYRHLVMYHRHVYELMFGEIPEGYEIDHKCKNRACCNPEHLQMLEGTEHTIKGNQERYAARKNKAYHYWKQTQCSGTKLGELFGVSFCCGSKWIRDWKQSV